MEKKKHTLWGALPLPASLLLGPAAHAGVVGGVITYGPQSASAVPTLGAGALILLAGLLALAAWRMHRAGQLRNNGLLGVALLVGVISAGAGSIRMAEAVIGFRLLDNPNGGSTPLVPGLNCVGNNSGVAQRIISIETTAGYVFDAGRDSVVNGGTCPDTLMSNAGGAAQACAEGSTLQPNGTCTAVISLLEEV